MKRQIYYVIISALVMCYILPTTQLKAQEYSPEIVLVEGGTFQMGSEDGDYDESPVHSATVGDFYIGKYEVTVAQYKLYCLANNKKMPLAPKWGWHDDHPIVNVSWNDATSYCKWLSLITGKKYRLPNEEEWEFAANGGNKSKGYRYSGSDRSKEVAWYDITTKEQGTKPIGTKKPNELGIYDMSGNVWEWCQDIYVYYPGNPKVNPEKGFQGHELRSLRGGSWFYDVKYARTPARDGPECTLINKNYGFRIALSK